MFWVLLDELGVYGVNRFEENVLKHLNRYKPDLQGLGVLVFTVTPTRNLKHNSFVLLKLDYYASYIIAFSGHIMLNSCLRALCVHFICQMW